LKIIQKESADVLERENIKDFFLFARNENKGSVQSPDCYLSLLLIKAQKL
jgi:hypothetical protein